jgi:hypothetical protein
MPAHDEGPKVHDEDEPMADGTMPGDVPNDVEQVWMRGEGGSIILMDLPLPHEIARRVDKGLIVRVNEDGSAWEPSDDDPELVPETEAERIVREREAALEYAELKRARPDEDPIVLRDEAADTVGDEIPEDAPQAGDEPKPKVSASKAVWVGYAKSHGMSHEDADAMTKAELVEKFS